MSLIRNQVTIYKFVVTERTEDTHIFALTNQQLLDLQIDVAHLHLLFPYDARLVTLNGHGITVCRETEHE
jgi:hypothetical protein